MSIEQASFFRKETVPGVNLW